MNTNLEPLEASLVSFIRRIRDYLRGQSATSSAGISAADVTTLIVNPILERLKTMSDTIDTELTSLKADVAAQSTVIASATTAFNGLVAKLAAAEQAAKDAGATDDQIAGFKSARQSIEANTAALAAAIPANTPAASTGDGSTPAQGDAGAGGTTTGGGTDTGAGSTGSQAGSGATGGAPDLPPPVPSAA